MNIKQIPSEIVSRDLRKIEAHSVNRGNIYEAIAAISKRANQLSAEQKEEIANKLSDFAPSSDNLDEIFENREQIEISSYYERLPKTTIIATEEFIDGEVYLRNPFFEKKD